MELIKRALADWGFRHGAIAGFSLAATIFCGTVAILLITGVLTT